MGCQLCLSMGRPLGTTLGHTVATLTPGRELAQSRELPRSGNPKSGHRALGLATLEA